MTPYTDWNNMNWHSCLQVFSMLTLPWVKPFISLLELPNRFVGNLEQWSEVYSVLLAQHLAQDQSIDWASIQQVGRTELYRDSVQKVLQRLATQFDQATEIELEQWIIFHFFTQEAATALFEWEAVLRSTYAIPLNRSKKRIPPPDSLAQMLLDLSPLVSFERRQQIREEIEGAAPINEYEQIEYERLDKPYEVILLRTAVDQALTFKALRTIAVTLDNTERVKVVEWAEAQQKALNPRYGEERAIKLCGDKYLQPGLAYLGLPRMTNETS